MLKVAEKTQNAVVLESESIEELTAPEASRMAAAQFPPGTRLQMPEPPQPVDDSGEPLSEEAFFAAAKPGQMYRRRFGAYT